MVKDMDDPQELSVISVRTGQFLGLGREVRLPFIIRGVLKVVGWDPRAHCWVFRGSSEQKLHMNLAPFFFLVVVMRGVSCGASKNGKSSVALKKVFFFSLFTQRAKLFPSSNLCL